MISGRVKQYIDDHALCSEYLFRDWESFLNLLYDEKGCISGILFWDYCKITEQRASLGSGGYKDPGNAEYMYAETQIYEDGLKNKTLAELKRFIRQVIGQYPGHCLVPSFYLDE